MKKEEIKKLEGQDIMMILDRTTGNLTVVTDLNPERGNFRSETWTSLKEFSGSMFTIDRNSPLQNFWGKFMEQFRNPKKFQFFVMPGMEADNLRKELNNAYQNGDPDAIKALQQKEVNVDGRVMSNVERYAFDERMLPKEELEKYGLDFDTLRQNRSMGDIMKGFITKPLPIYSQNEKDQWDEIGRSCFQIKKDENGSGKLVVHTILEKPEFEKEPIKKALSKKALQNIGNGLPIGEKFKIKEKGIETEYIGTYHPDTQRIFKVPVDQVTVSNRSYSYEFSDKEMNTIADGGWVDHDIQRKDGVIRSGRSYYDAVYGDTRFTSDKNQALRVGLVVNGAAVSKDQARKLENNECLFIPNMNINGRRVSTNIRFTPDGRQLRGKKALEFRVKNFNGKKPAGKSSRKVG